MTRLKLLGILLLLFATFAGADILTIEGALNLSLEGETLASQLYQGVRNRGLKGSQDEEARRQLLGICETFRNLRGEFESGVIVPRKSLLHMSKLKTHFEPVCQSLPLAQQESPSLQRLLQILKELQDYAHQNGVIAGGAATPPSNPTMPVATIELPPSPSNTSASSLSWCQVGAQGTVETNQVSAPAPLPSGTIALTPCVEVNPQGPARINRIGLALQQTLQPGQTVGLMFYSQASRRWISHPASYDRATNQVTARVNHASVWLAVTGTLFRTAKESAHYRIYYYPSQVSATEAEELLQKLEGARRHLQSLGLYLENKQIDVYISQLSTKKDINYGGHVLSALGGYMELNLPSELKKLGSGVLQATIVHEVLHDVQLVYYQRIDSAVARNVELRRRLRGVFSYGQLNEALSSWVELDMLKANSYPPASATLYSYSPDFHRLGLKTSNIDAGYGGGYFIDYLTRRYGRELLASVLSACREQGPVSTRLGQRAVYNNKRDGFKALVQGMKYRTRALGLGEGMGIEADWLDYVGKICDYELQGLDPRVKRRKLLQTTGLETLEAGQSRQYSDTVNPLSVGRVIRVLVKPGSGPDRKVKVTVEQDVSGGDVKVATLLYAGPSYSGLAENSILSTGSRKVTDIIGSGSRTGDVTFKPGQNHAAILVVPVGLKGYDPAQLSLKVTSEVSSGQKRDDATKTTPLTKGSYRPSISSLSTPEAATHQVITIYGSGFGPAPATLNRRLSLFSGTAVVFRTHINGHLTEVEAHVLTWSDSAISVRVPSAHYGYSPITVGVYRERVASNFVPFKLKKK